MNESDTDNPWWFDLDGIKIEGIVLKSFQKSNELLRS